eukprot:6479753-Pyramimonas_sp.AAC.1
MAEQICADGGDVAVAASGILEAAKEEGSKKVRIVLESPVYLYGVRPVDAPGAPDLARSSLYEFLRNWRIELAATIIRCN